MVAKRVVRLRSKQKFKEAVNSLLVAVATHQQVNLPAGECICYRRFWQSTSAIYQLAFTFRASKTAERIAWGHTALRIFPLVYPGTVIWKGTEKDDTVVMNDDGIAGNGLFTKSPGYAAKLAIITVVKTRFCISRPVQ